MTMVGGGLGGALMAVYLGKAGYPVDVYEMRGDLRTAELARGRSINLALSTRGFHALGEVGLTERIRENTIPMRGRMIHAVDGGLTFQPYGKDESQAIHSISRNGLNAMLLDAAEACPSVSLHFHEKCVGVDLDAATAEFRNTETGDRRHVEADQIIGADGAFSAVRRRMQRLDRFDYQQDYLEHGYKELAIPPADGGGFRIEKNALHIWPRHTFMMIALPNSDGSFTCTLFWPFDGPYGFSAIRDENDLQRFFERWFPDALPLMPTLVEDYFAGPPSSLVTIRCYPWSHRDKVVLLGDACHAVVPFYGQGMNCAFEDCTILNEFIDRHAPDWEKVFRCYQEERKENADTLADLAIENFIEMRDRVASPFFLLHKRIEKTLYKLFPRWYIPLYSRVTFSRMPYAQAVDRARRQEQVLRAVLWGAVLLILFLIVASLRPR